METVKSERESIKAQLKELTQIINILKISGKITDEDIERAKSALKILQKE